MAALQSLLLCVLCTAGALQHAAPAAQQHPLAAQHGSSATMRSLLFSIGKPGASSLTQKKGLRGGAATTASSGDDDKSIDLSSAILVTKAPPLGKATAKAKATATATATAAPSLCPSVLTARCCHCLAPACLPSRATRPSTAQVAPMVAPCRGWWPAVAGWRRSPRRVWGPSERCGGDVEDP